MEWCPMSMTMFLTKIDSNLRYHNLFKIRPHPCSPWLIYSGLGDLRKPHKTIPNNYRSIEWSFGFDLCTIKWKISDCETKTTGSWRFIIKIDVVGYKKGPVPNIYIWDGTLFVPYIYFIDKTSSSCTKTKSVTKQICILQYSPRHGVIDVSLY